MRYSLTQGCIQCPRLVPSFPRNPVCFRNPSIYCSIVFILLQTPFPATPFVSHPYKTPGVSPSGMPLRGFLASVPPCLRGKSHILCNLQPLCRVSLRSFLHSFSLFSTACSLFLQNLDSYLSP